VKNEFLKIGGVSSMI